MNELEKVCRECFNALLQLRDLGTRPTSACDGIRTQLIAYIANMEQLGQHAQVDSIDIDHAKYAIAALADEIALNSNPEIREAWQSDMLQFRYFQENRAGDGFFHRMTAVMRDPARIASLRVYALCLAFGFRGKYAMGGELELDALRRQVSEYLGMGHPLPISNHQQRPRAAQTGTGSRIPFLWIAAFLFIFSMVFVTSFKCNLDSRTDKLNDRMIQLKGGEQAPQPD